jgi:hypothetical protein
MRDLSPSRSLSLSLVPVATIVDSQVSVTYDTTDGAGAYSITLAADTAEYREDVFYNGPIVVFWNALTTAGVVNLVTGPCRLLTAWIWNTNASTSTEIDVALTPVLRADGVGNGGQLSWPSPGQIVTAGESIQMRVNAITAGFAFAGVTTAHP